MKYKNNLIESINQMTFRKGLENFLYTYIRKIFNKQSIEDLNIPQLAKIYEICKSNIDLPSGAFR